jgi:hypothetical protein
MKKLIAWIPCLLFSSLLMGQKDWVQGKYYLEKGSTEVICSEQTERVLEYTESLSAYYDPPQKQQRGYKSCMKRSWSKKTFIGTVYQWNEFREEWDSIEAEGDFWIFHWVFFKERVF